MRRPKKNKTSTAPVSQRKPAISSSAAARRAFPAWIAADENGVAFSAQSVVTPRVRDALVLRPVTRPKPLEGKGTSDDPGAR